MKKIVAFTGAGISAESGIQTFVNKSAVEAVEELVRLT